MTQTIFALATAFGKAGVAVVRVSGKNAFAAIEKMTSLKNVLPRQAYFCPLKTLDQKPLDEILLLWFEAPKSFTGENVVEFHLHGGRAIISKVLEELSKIEGFRPAERGEFTRRAVENGKMDLTKAEGLADLIDAETDVQRRQALRQMDGALADLYEGWHAELVHILAWLEAYIDFPEEEVPQHVTDEIYEKINTLLSKITTHLNDSSRGEKLRDGYKIVLLGAPNAGKSSLMNALAKKDVAIVSEKAGTTRDIIEVKLDLNGYPVFISDTAGLRETNEEIEQEGIRRALNRAEEADLILAVLENEPFFQTSLPLHKIIKVQNKIDLLEPHQNADISISAKTGEGLPELLSMIGKRVEDELSLREEPSLTRLRHRLSLEECKTNLENALKAPQTVLLAEDVRLAMRALGVITGQVKVDELLDIIFKDFCIGK